MINVPRGVGDDDKPLSYLIMNTSDFRDMEQPQWLY